MVLKIRFGIGEWIAVVAFVGALSGNGGGYGSTVRLSRHSKRDVAADLMAERYNSSPLSYLSYNRYIRFLVSRAERQNCYATLLFQFYRYWRMRLSKYHFETAR